jgi:hypothetical protein
LFAAGSGRGTVAGARRSENPVRVVVLHPAVRVLLQVVPAPHPAVLALQVVAQVLQALQAPAVHLPVPVHRVVHPPLQVLQAAVRVHRAVVLVHFQALRVHQFKVCLAAVADASYLVMMYRRIHLHAEFLELKWGSPLKWRLISTTSVKVIVPVVNIGKMLEGILSTDLREEHG